MHIVQDTKSARHARMPVTNLRIENNVEQTMLFDAGTSGPINCTVGENATLNVIHMISENHEDQIVTEYRSDVKKNGTINFWHILFSGKSNEFKTETFLNGEGARTNHVTIFLGSNCDLFSLSVSNIHNAPNTFSRMESKGIVNDKARVKYDGLVEMTKLASGADGALIQKALMLSPTSVVEAVPALEIGTNDVRASHSAAVTQVDQEQLFYAAARGISKRAAILMIADGFLRPTIDSIPNDGIRQKLFNMIPDMLGTN